MTRYLGLDLGSVTCGVSESDTGLIARTVETIRFRPDDYNEAMDKVLLVIEREKPDLIVIGYPLLLNDDEGPRAQLCREFGEELEKECRLILSPRFSQKVDGVRLFEKVMELSAGIRLRYTKNRITFLIPKRKNWIVTVNEVMNIAEKAERQKNEA